MHSCPTVIGVQLRNDYAATSMEPKTEIALSFVVTIYQ